MGSCLYLLALSVSRGLYTHKIGQVENDAYFTSLLFPLCVLHCTMLRLSLSFCIRVLSFLIFPFMYFLPWFHRSFFLPLPFLSFPFLALPCLALPCPAFQSFVLSFVLLCCPFFVRYLFVSFVLSICALCPSQLFSFIVFASLYVFIQAFIRCFFIASCLFRYVSMYFVLAFVSSCFLSKFPSVLSVFLVKACMACVPSWCRVMCFLHCIRYLVLSSVCAFLLGDVWASPFFLMHFVLSFFLVLGLLGFLEWV